MAHEVESMFSVRLTPWHQLGTILSDAPKTSHEAMRAAGADWEVRKLPLGLLGASESIDSHRAIVRETDMRVLGVVGARYEPVQNADAFAWFDNVVGEGRASFETAGVLREGKVVWVLAQLAEGFEVVPGDRVNGFLLLSNTHDGSRSVEARFTPIRVVCANTLGAAHAGDASADRAIKIRHTASVKSRMDEAARVLGVAARQIEDTAEAYRAIARVQLTTGKAMELFEKIVGGERDAAGKLHTRSANVVKVLGELFNGAGVGLDMPGVRGTAWAAYNAVTEYVDYRRGESKSDAARLESMAFGSGHEMKARALNAALALAA